MDISEPRLLQQFLVRMNTASEKVLRRRSSRGATLLYDLRFRHNTVHCAAKFSSLLGVYALRPVYPASEASSAALTNGLFDASNRDILFNLASYKGRRRAAGAKLFAWGQHIQPPPWPHRAGHERFRPSSGPHLGDGPLQLRLQLGTLETSLIVP